MAEWGFKSWYPRFQSDVPTTKPQNGYCMCAFVKEERDHKMAATSKIRCGLVFPVSGGECTHISQPLTESILYLCSIWNGRGCSMLVQFMIGKVPNVGEAKLGQTGTGQENQRSLVNCGFFRGDID